jgi:hypothetical protein
MGVNMGPGGDFLDLLMTYGWMIPYVLVWFTGLVLALVYWRRHPGVSCCTVVALSLFILSFVGGTFLQRMIMVSWANQMGGENMHVMKSYMAMLTIARTALGTAAWILILMAVLGWRRQSARLIAEEPPGPRPLLGPRGSGFPPTAITEGRGQS